MSIIKIETCRLLLLVPLLLAHGQGVLTRHKENEGTGQNLNEATLNLSSVNADTFGKLLTLPANVYAQSLHAANASIDSNNLTTVDYSTTIFKGNPKIFGGNRWQTKTPFTAQTVSLGITFSRNFVALRRVVPTTTVAKYLAELRSGCPAGSVCDPNTWTWSAFSGAEILQAQSQGIPLMICVIGPPTWLTYNGGKNGVPTNFAVYNDMFKKVYQHYSPAYIEILNEPDIPNIGTDSGLDITGSPYSTAQAAYDDIYNNTAAAIRSASSSVQIGGPAICCATPTKWIPQFISAVSPATNLNFISYHNYEANNDELFLGTDMVALAHLSAPGIPVFATEWNANGGCSSDTLNGGDGNPRTVSFWGMRLINGINEGLTGMVYWALNDDVSCSWVTGAAINLKSRAVEVMSVTLGLGAGNFSVKNTANNGATAAMGAVNSAGEHILLVVNNTGRPASQVVTLTNTGFMSNVTWKTYIASTLVDPAVGPGETIILTPSEGTVTHTISLPPDSVAGILVR